MKKTRKAFTLVELIIVIAVIGVLAAILIPVFSDVIKKANVKSAMSDAKNSLDIYIAETVAAENSSVIGTGSVFKVKKAGKDFYFTYTGGVKEGDGTANADAETPLNIDYNSLTALAFSAPNCVYDTAAESNMAAHASIFAIPELPDNVMIYVMNADVTYTPAPGSVGYSTPASQHESNLTAAQAVAAFASDSSLPNFTNGSVVVSKSSDGLYYQNTYVVSSDGTTTYYSLVAVGSVSTSMIQDLVTTNYTVYKSSGASVVSGTEVSALSGEVYVFIHN